VNKYNSTTPWEAAQHDLAPGASQETAVPARPAGLISDVLVPVLQAAISGGLLAALVVFAMSELVPGWDADLLKVWAITALAITAMAWILLLADSRRLLWASEKVTGIDLDGDGTIGQPRDRLVFVDREKAKEEAAQERKRGEWLTFVSFVRQLPARGTTLTAWESEIGRARYTEFRDALIDYGLACWLSTKADGTPNKTQGWELTATVDEILDRISIN
jgi:hypothetical protein